jgi:hypothetical protein
MFAGSVGRTLVGSQISSDIRGHTQDRHHVCTRTAVKPLVKNHTSSDTRGYPQGLVTLPLPNTKVETSM